MKKILVVSIITLFACTGRTLVADDIKFTITSTFGELFGGSKSEQVSKSIKTSDGGYIVVGRTTSGISGEITDSANGLEDALIVKTDQNGNIIWQNVFGGSKYDDFKSISELSDGSYIAVGTSTSSRSGEISEINNSGLAALSGDDGLIVKFDKDGNVLFDNLFGGSGDDELYGVSATKDGGFIAVGKTLGTSDNDITDSENGSYDSLIVKFDKDGNEMWQDRFGGDYGDELKDVIETSDGGYVAVGASKSYFGEIDDHSVGMEDGLIVKFNKNGTKEWSHLYGDNKSDYFNSIVETSDGDLIAVGTSESTNFGDITDDYNGMYDGLMVSFDKNGNALWDQLYGGDSNSVTEFNSIIEGSDGKLITSGSYKSKTNLPGGEVLSTPKGNKDGIFVEFNENGQYIADGIFGGSDIDIIESMIEYDTDQYLIFSTSGSEDGDVTDVSNGSSEILINLLIHKTNEKPVLLGVHDQTLTVGDVFDPMKGVSATDFEDGDLTGSIINRGSVDTSIPGEYYWNYGVTDSDGNYEGQVANIKVVDSPASNNLPIIKGAVDTQLEVGEEFDPMKDVSASDVEDGDLTSGIKIIANDLDTTKIGIYKITYKVVDSDSNSALASRNIKVVDNSGAKPTKPGDGGDITPMKPGDNNDSNVGLSKTGSNSLISIGISIITLCIIKRFIKRSYIIVK